MNKLKTHKGDTLLLIEVPKDATFVSKYNLQISYRLPSEGYVYVKDIPISSKNCEFIGTTSTLTDEQANNLIKDFTYTKGMSGDIWFKCDTLNEFLEANNIDTTKNYVILKLLNNG